jgi:FtsP/CotA-like multicopper oxidase with cupredoxin domain
LAAAWRPAHPAITAIGDRGHFARAPMKRLSRRAFLGAGIGVSLWAWSRADAQTPSLAPGGDGVLALQAGPASLILGAAASTPGLGYNGGVPGPLLRFRRVEAVRVRLVNTLTTPSTLAFPGLRPVNAALGIGGLTQPSVAPGASLETKFVPPDPGFNLYMPHAGKDSANQIAKGLFGPIVVEEAAPPSVDLEAIVILCDWSLDPRGEILDLDDARFARGAGRVGGVITANAAPAPLALNAPPGGRVRLRIANAATARTMTIAIEGVKPQIIAVDGQPSEPFAPLHNLVPMGPGARFELVFDLGREAGAVAKFTLRGGDAAAIPGETDRPLIAVSARGDPVSGRGELPALPQNPKLPVEIALESSRRVDLAISGGGEAPFAIDGVTFKDWGAKPSFAVGRGTPVTLGLINRTAVAQTIRLNGHVARLLHPLDDGWEPYWRDILIVQPGKTIHAAFVADNPGKWPIESSSPERRNAGLATWFQVN